MTEIRGVMRDQIVDFGRRGAELWAQRIRRDGLPPGPTRPAVKQLYDWFMRPLEMLEMCRARYGLSFTFRFPMGERIVLTGERAAIEAIFRGDPQELRAGEANAIFEPIFGPNSLFTLDGARHRRQRRLLTPPLHGERMHRYGTLTAEIANEVAAKFPIGHPFPIHAEMQRITLEVILTAVFGMREGAERARLRTLLVDLLDSMANPIYFFIWAQANRGTRYGRLGRLLKAVNQAIYAAISDRQRDAIEGREDVLSLLISARDEEGRPMTPDELRDEIVTLLLAGHETTATALAWACHRLTVHPDVAERVYREVDEVIGDGPFDPRRVGELRYLDAVIKETLRLNPIVPAVSRRVKQRVKLGSLDLPPGVVVAPCIYVMHRSADVWPDPERFEPERFLDVTPSPFAYLPFGGGHRRCIGAAFAMYEMKVVLASLLSRYRLEAAPGYRVRMVRRSIVFSPAEGMPVVVRRR